MNKFTFVTSVARYRVKSERTLSEIASMQIISGLDKGWRVDQYLGSGKIRKVYIPGAAILAVEEGW